MSRLDTEAFIRRHVRRILTEEEDKPKGDKPKGDKPKGDKPKEKQSQGQGQVWSGLKGGRLPKWAIEALGGSKKAERLAETNPAQLMKNLKLSPASGSTTVDRVAALIRQSQSSRPEMGKAFGTPSLREDATGKKGVLIPAGELAGRTGSIIIHDLVYGAWKAGYLKLSGNIRLESQDGGTLVFNVSKRSDRWE
jgi:hypothetical protein